MVFSASFTKIILFSEAMSMRTKSPSFTCPVATRFASGNTRLRSIARFKCRAPYRGSVPSFSKYSFTAAVQLNTNWFVPAAISTRCCTIPNSMSRICARCSSRSVHRRPLNLVIERLIDLNRLRRESKAAVHQRRHLPRTQVRSHDDDALRQIHPPVIAQRQRRLIQNPQQELPQRIRRLLDFVKQQNRELQLLRIPLVQRFLREQRMRLPVPQISRRRSNQLRNLMRMLELRAINLDASPRVAEQRLGHRLDHSRLSRSRRPQKQQVPHRTSRRVQPRQKHLIDFNHLLNRLLLSDNAAAQGAIKLSGIVAATVRIEHCCEVGSHKVVAGIPGHF